MAQKYLADALRGRKLLAEYEFIGEERADKIPLFACNRFSQATAKQKGTQTVSPLPEAIGAAFVERAGDLVPTSSLPEKSKYPQFVKNMHRTLEQCKELRHAYQAVMRKPYMDFNKELDTPFAAFSHDNYDVARHVCVAVNSLISDLSLRFPATASDAETSHILDSLAKFEAVYAGGISKFDEKRAEKMDFLTSSNFQTHVAQRRLEQSIKYLLANTDMKPKDVTKLAKGFIKKHEVNREELPIPF